MDRLDRVIANLQRKQPERVPNIRKRDRHNPKVESDDENEVKSKNEHGQILVAEVGRMIHRWDRLERRPRKDLRGFDGWDEDRVYRNLGIPTFEGRNNLKAYSVRKRS